MTYRDRNIYALTTDPLILPLVKKTLVKKQNSAFTPSRFSHAIFSNLIICMRAGFFWLIYLYLRASAPSVARGFPEFTFGKWHVSPNFSALIAFFLLLQLSTRAFSPLWNRWLCHSPTSIGRLSLFLEPSFGHALKRFQKVTNFSRTLAILGNSNSTGVIARSLSPVSDIVSVFELDIEDEETALGAVRELGRNGEVNTLVLAQDHHGRLDIAALINHLREMPLQVLIYSENTETARETRRTQSLGGLPLSIVSDAPIHFFGRALKYSFDRSCALLLILLSLPLLLAIALAVATESKGPVIFRQCRNGWAGTHFTVYKFRTMRAGAPSSYQTQACDPRLTRIGSFLRRSSLDELPQLFNVLFGEMSLVGPRPHVDALHACECVGEAIIANYARRYRMKPGMTGWAQVNGLRGPIHSPGELRRRVELDLYYIEHWSFFLDLKILLLTPFCVLRGKNAL